MSREGHAVSRDGFEITISQCTRKTTTCYTLVDILCGSFPARGRPRIFSQQLDMVFNRAGTQDKLHYLDDFLFFSLPAMASAIKLLLQSAVVILEQLGFPVAREKAQHARLHSGEW